MHEAPVEGDGIGEEVGDAPETRGWKEAAVAPVALASVAAVALASVAAVALASVAAVAFSPYISLSPRLSPRLGPSCSPSPRHGLPHPCAIGPTHVRSTPPITLPRVYIYAMAGLTLPEGACV